MLEDQGIDDRAVDLWSPLVAVALAADAEDGGQRAVQVLAAARELSAVRDADGEASPTAKLIEALEAIRREKGDTVAPADLLAEIQSRGERIKTTRRLAALLNPLGIARRQVWTAGARRWCYILDGEQLGELRTRYAG